jgi:hypothetical protein
MPTKPKVNKAEQCEEAARNVANSLLASDLTAPEVALVLTTALAFVFKVAFEPNGASVYEMSEHLKFNFIETTNGMRKATIQ